MLVRACLKTLGLCGRCSGPVKSGVQVPAHTRGHGDATPYLQGARQTSSGSLWPLKGREMRKLGRLP